MDNPIMDFIRVKGRSKFLILLLCQFSYLNIAFQTDIYLTEIGKDYRSKNLKENWSLKSTFWSFGLQNRKDKLDILPWKAVVYYSFMECRSFSHLFNMLEKAINNLS